MDYEILRVKLEVERIRLLTWGEVVGLSDAQLDETNSRILIDQRLVREGVRSTVEELLGCIEYVFANAETLQRKYGLKEEPSQSIESPGSAFQVGGLGDNQPVLGSIFGRAYAGMRKSAKEIQQAAPFKRKVTWVISDKEKFSKLIAEIRGFNDSLESLFPDITRKAASKMLGEIGESNGIRDLQLLQQATADEHEDISESASVRLESLGATTITGLDDLASVVTGMTEARVLEYLANISVDEADANSEYVGYEGIVEGTAKSSPNARRKSMLEKRMENGRNWTPLQRAAFESTDSEGWTSLHRSAFRGDEGTVRELLNVPVSTTTKDANGQTPLHIAAYYGHDIVAKTLLASGADKDARNFKGHTPLYVAASRGLTSTVGVFVDGGADVEARDDEKKTSLYAAARYGHEAVARLLVEKGANKEARGAASWAPLHAAAWHGHEAVVGLLVDRGSDKEVRNEERKTPLYVAAQCGHENVIRLLLEKGAERNVRVRGGWTPLHAAAWYGHEMATRVLVENNADMEARSQDGETPLFTAARNGHEAVVRLLLQQGADKKAEADGRWTPLRVARANGHEAVVRVLKSFRT
jgi:ankyrin repeat protein